MPQKWAYGGITIEGTLYKADKDNNWLADLSEHIDRGTVSWNADRGGGVKLQAEFMLKRRDVIQHRVDWLAPVLTITWGDGSIETQQYGLFLTDFPNDEISEFEGSSRVLGFDPTWVTLNQAARDTVNVAAIDVCTTKARDMLIAGGWSRIDMPASARTFGSARSWWKGTRYYGIAAAILEGMGWYHPYSDLTGVLRFRPYVDLVYEEPSIIIGMEDGEERPVDKVRVVPTATNLANIIEVRKERTEDAAGPIVSIRENSDPSSPTSTARMATVLRVVDASEIQTQAEADALAEQYLREAGSFYRVLSVVLPPGTWPRPFQTAQVNLQSDDWGDLTGRYHIREWSVGFSPADAPIHLELNQIAGVEPDEDAQ